MSLKGKGGPAILAQCTSAHLAWTSGRWGGVCSPIPLESYVESASQQQQAREGYSFAQIRLAHVRREISYHGPECQRLQDVTNGTGQVRRRDAAMASMPDHLGVDLMPHGQLHGAFPSWPTNRPTDFPQRH